MKKFIFALAGLCLLSIPGLADNNIKMVTYFPVPYVSYGDLTVTSTCDVGLLGSCNLDVGEGLEIFKSSSSNQALNTGSLIVRQGALSLNSSLASSSVNGSVLNVGSGEISGSLEFGHNLVVDQMAGNKVQSLEARNKAYLSGLTLFGEEFPVCDEANHEINWKKLTVNGKEGVFLVCGGGSEAVEETCAQNPNQEKCCTENQEWNGTTCETKSCPTPTHYPPECSSCTFPSTNNRSTITVKGQACEGWNTETCDWDWSLAKCTPNKNVWLIAYSSRGSISGICGTSAEIISSPLTEGAECDSYGADFVRHVMYRYDFSSNGYTASCIDYICTNISPSSTFDR